MNSQTFKLLAAAVSTSILAASAVALAQNPTKKITTAEPTAPAAVLMVAPIVYANDEKLGQGCWARLYDGGGYTGLQYVLVGPVEVPALRGGLGLNEKYDSIVVGPKATLTVYDNVNYRDKAATLNAASRTPDLDDKMALFETIRSLKLACAA